MSICLVLIVFSCNTSKKVAENKSGVEITSYIPCSEYELSTAEYFRSTANAVSWDLQTAKNSARLEAEAVLAGSVQSFISLVQSSYENNLTKGNTTENAKLFEGLIYRVVQQTLIGVESTCFKVNVLPDGRYQVFYGVQVKNDMLDKILNSISTDEEMNIRFQRELFKKSYDEALQNYIQEQKTTSLSVY